ncbi:MAG: ABC-type transport auxiliary lipoprotein family protein [Gammaproteobacteria bacterium]|nr:ABC-type transport auxiliary lipoprotein family protein [Gammaproteobacteria bacterium]
MNRLLSLGLALATGMGMSLLLAACVSLPGEDAEPADRYMLKGPEPNCASGGPPLILSIIKVSSGLNTDRIARRDAATGQFTYLQGVRWVDRIGSMLEQRLAKDLECKGYSVITSHHAQLNNDQLVCEVRALNLVQSSGNNSAEVSLSCVKFNNRGKQQDTILSSHTSPLRSWGINDAMTAMAESYALVLEDLGSRL